MKPMIKTSKTIYLKNNAAALRWILEAGRLLGVPHGKRDTRIPVEFALNFADLQRATNINRHTANRVVQLLEEFGAVTTTKLDTAARINTVVKTTITELEEFIVRIESLEP